MLLAVLSGFILALFAPSIHRATREYTGWLLALLPAALFLYFAGYIQTIADGEVVSSSISWVNLLDVRLDFMLDGLSLLMVLIITGVGTLIVIYAGGYLKGDALIGRFYAYLLSFMAAMVGVVLSDNLITLFIFWELTSITSYLLIGYKHNYDDSRAAALKALVTTGAGGLAMLAGFILLAVASGTWRISSLDTHAQLIQQSDLYLPILILVCIGAFTKSAQFPFHYWLPGAMAAPTPVSAYLHSATMVKAGVYLLARMSPSLGHTDEWTLIVTSVGVITMLMGGYLSLKQYDLKRILAYSTISSLGMLIMLLGWNTKVAIEAAMLFLLVHSLYKGALFMVAGAIDHETGTRDIEGLGGLWRVMPMVAIGTLLAALSMSGIPPLLGFIGKELIYEATLEYEFDVEFVLTFLPALLTFLAVIANMAAIAVACMVTIQPFAGKLKDTPKHPHRAPIALWLGAVLLGIVALALGLFAQIPSKYLVGPAAEVVYGNDLTLKLSLWHGVTPMLILSIITIAGGVMIFWQRYNIRPILNYFDPGAYIGPDLLFVNGIDALPSSAKRFTLIFQSGKLRYYVSIIVLTLIFLVGYVIIARVELPTDLTIEDVRFYELIIPVVILIGVTFVLFSRSLLFTVAALGVIGYGESMIFVLYGAPDLAMTQFAIETLTVILFVLVLYKLPPLVTFSTRRARYRDGIIAIAAGAMITTLILVITALPKEAPLTEFFAGASYDEAQGRNIVNVILVDFRGFDTLGEIIVLGVAALGVYALLKLRPGEFSKTADIDDPEPVIKDDRSAVEE
ncbi:MAG: putative monovalent cation/H+ antiporter subunit A [Aggregatilineales bacterium]